MKKNLLALVVCALSVAASAQEVNKCNIGGKVVYQQSPCPGADIKVKQVVVAEPKTAPYVGMFKGQIEGSSWGEPMYVNVTTTATTRREQWVYFGHRYIYVRDGLVTAIQE